MVIDTKQHLDELARFIRDHRGSEAHFEKLNEKLAAACAAATSNADQSDYAAALKETLEKHAETYRQQREKGASAWPEFENFVSHFEKAVTAALRES